MKKRLLIALAIVAMTCGMVVAEENPKFPVSDRSMVWESAKPLDCRWEFMKFGMVAGSLYYPDNAKIKTINETVYLVMQAHPDWEFSHFKIWQEKYQEPASSGSTSYCKNIWKEYHDIWLKRLVCK